MEITFIIRSTPINEIYENSIVVRGSTLSALTGGTVYSIKALGSVF